MAKINIGGYDINITNHNKILWPKYGITKLNYLEKLISLSEYLLPFTNNRYLTTIRYPNGVNKDFFFQKNKPKSAPEWVDTNRYHDKEYIHLNHIATLLWLGNQGAIEYHLSFNPINKDNYPSSLVFDLDPSEGQDFNEVIEVALIVKETLEGMNILSYIKTSGATGLQIFIPIGSKYDYDTARNINAFFGQYFAEKYPNKITIERMVDKRNKKLYFDYLQMWEGKTIIAPYSPRATEFATVSTPLLWEEVENGCHPRDYNLLNIEDRLKKKGNVLEDLLDESKAQDLDFIIKYINKK
ncbi:bifunctional non-homologous end joining protein LigD [Natranaerovirga pectinivora]|uniref:Bifunctional non-homologous end joining protein LigD n=1 Tax=Natranaerovirga pectinivora TaxID=682400 RepID=A0A4R3MJ51_9FIRM|nr:non-homologous end-joining DNA ligase [Natranaerovirga pectinivora]TCT14294.1 bifunctional non-homologous end joining protein LigD [Natranaerovirga pectinivora]